jgi:hypothetical protein
MLELKSRHHPLGGEHLHHLGIGTRHHQLIGCRSKDEAHEAIFAVGRSSTNTVIAADGKFNFVAH